MSNYLFISEKKKQVWAGLCQNIYLFISFRKKQVWRPQIEYFRILRVENKLHGVHHIF
jgi:hypothetical protein